MEATQFQHVTDTVQGLDAITGFSEEILGPAFKGTIHDFGVEFRRHNQDGKVVIALNLVQFFHDPALGMLYAKGRGVSQSNEESQKWLIKGAEHGDSLAVTKLAMSLITGRGTPADQPRGLAMLVQASNAGSSIAPILLGQLYAGTLVRGGDFIPVDKAKVRLMFHRAEKQKLWEHRKPGLASFPVEWERATPPPAIIE